MKHNSHKLLLCQVWEKSQAGFLILIAPMLQHSKLCLCIWQLLYGVLLCFQKLHDEKDEAGGHKSSPIKRRSSVDKV